MISAPVASQILHAVGYAMGAALDRKAVVTLVYFGDGATSQGDFSEGCNFAAVFRAPVIFFCQNNHWAISVPLAKQTAAPIYKKADAYGFPGVRVDGNDVLAVLKVTREGAARAQEGTPTLIEAVTYRLGPHSTADDASRYQSAKEIEVWKALDPISRYRAFLDSRGLLNDKLERNCEEESDKLAAHIREGIVGAAAPPLDDLFRWVFAVPTPRLLEQKRELLDEEVGHADA
jgi:pyruvate dehydrogenase E1 component alpha subunit